ncbi:hypothetical protein RJ639_039239, partial [Escallonia herrerae]
SWEIFVARKMKGTIENPLHLKSLNHISIVCRSVEESLDFYQNVLGFFPIRRPGSFDFDGAWDVVKDSIDLGANPHACESMGTVEKKLKEMKIEYVKRRVEEGGIYVDQLFFHDPDGSTIEICNCDNLPVVPLAGEAIRSCSRINFGVQQKQIQQLAEMKVPGRLPYAFFNEKVFVRFICYVVFIVCFLQRIY